MRENVSAAARIRVMKRDRFICTYCGASGNDVELEVDHIIPVAKGGSNHISNLTTSCFSCNRKKGTKDIRPKKTFTEKWLIDKPVHLLDSDGDILNQGSVIDGCEDHFLIQRYSFKDGCPTDIIKISYADMFDESKVKIYGDDQAWSDAFQKWLTEKRAVK